jgi:hypothetical protein
MPSSHTRSTHWLINARIDITKIGKSARKGQRYIPKPRNGLRALAIDLMIVVKQPHRILHFLGGPTKPALVAGLFEARFRGFLGSLWWETTDTVKLGEKHLESGWAFWKKEPI